MEAGSYDPSEFLPTLSRLRIKLQSLAEEATAQGHAIALPLTPDLPRRIPTTNAAAAAAAAAAGGAGGSTSSSGGGVNANENASMQKASSSSAWMNGRQGLTALYGGTLAGEDWEDVQRFDVEDEDDEDNEQRRWRQQRQGRVSRAQAQVELSPKSSELLRGADNLWGASSAFLQWSKTLIGQAGAASFDAFG
jgi:hypothetical protein